ncbi:hypothetical protein GQ457_06G027580 [Hibiscus cannabinus]
MSRQEGRHGGVVEGEDGYGLASVDLRGQVSGGEVVVEGGELRVFGEDESDVGCIGRGGEGEEEEEEGKGVGEEGGGRWRRHGGGEGGGLGE